MTAIGGRPVSPWLDGVERADRPRLERDVEVDVAVVGGGIIGLTAALMAQRAGARVAVLEGRRIGGGVSGNTTAKLSSLHGLTYAKLASSHGTEAARAYGDINEAGLAAVAALVDELEIECDFSRRSNLTYSEDPHQRGKIEAEASAALAAGLPASYVEDADLPFGTAAAVRFADQAQFNPVPYMAAIADALDSAEPCVYERTRAVTVDGAVVRTGDGLAVSAERVIVATQLPFLDRGLFFARARPSRSYALSARVATRVPQEMYLSTDRPARSLRSLSWRGEELLIVAGEAHAAGQGDPVERFRSLERYARERLGAVEIEHRWAAHDYLPDDGLPYIGRLSPTSDRVLTATGMRKWGLAMGTGAAIALADAVGGRANPWMKAFDPWRVPSVSAALPIVKHGLDSGLHFFADRLRRDAVEGLGPGEGRVVGHGLGQRAVHRDDSGTVHELSARCTHLGCIVRWNGAERTWDCPCHGSRFTSLGEVLSGPATRPLSRYSNA